MAETKVKEVKKAVREQAEKIEDKAVEITHTADDFYSKNKNPINIALTGIAVLVGGYFLYQNFYKKPLLKTSLEESWQAQTYFEMDSFALALNGKGDDLGFIDIIDEYGSTPVGNMAYYYAGISALQLGQFEDAIGYLNDFSTTDVNLKPIAIGAKGDAYSELNDIDNAIEAYKDAADINNAFTAPIYLMKLAGIAEQNGKYDMAIEAYKTIENQYGESEEARSVQKYLVRAESLAKK